jgi:hypothetical protein
MRCRLFRGGENSGPLLLETKRAGYVPFLFVDLLHWLTLAPKRLDTPYWTGLTFNADSFLFSSERIDNEIQISYLIHTRTYKSLIKY